MQTDRYLLATDLDGTFIPISGHSQNRDDLATIVNRLEQTGGTLVYITGRHLESVLDAISKESIPSPEWIVGDVGTSVFRRDGDTYQQHRGYTEHLLERTGGIRADHVGRQASAIELLRPQLPIQQGEFKSSWFCDADQIGQVVSRVEVMLDQSGLPFGVINSIDPITGEGLIDLLPVGVTKAHALSWLASELTYCDDDVLFAGDSGNDLAAMTAGYHAIVVSNATGTVREDARAFHQERGTADRLFESTLEATSGVLEGLEHFLHRRNGSVS